MSDSELREVLRHALDEAEMPECEDYEGAVVGPGYAPKDVCDLLNTLRWRVGRYGLDEGLKSPQEVSAILLYAEEMICQLTSQVAPPEGFSRWQSLVDDMRERFDAERALDKDAEYRHELEEAYNRQRGIAADIQVRLNEAELLLYGLLKAFKGALNAHKGMRDAWDNLDHVGNSAQESESDT